jgi:hypothetical protein
MPSKDPAWLSAYQRVSDKQQEYLRKIHDLRRSIQNRDEQMMMIAIQRQRLLRGRRKNPRNPKMTDVVDIQIHNGPQPFPHRQTEKRFYFAPTFTPRKLPPIIKGKQLVDSRSEPSDKDKESIEIIAKRNNINFSFIDGLSPSGSPSQRAFHRDRQLLNVSRVSIREDDKNRHGVGSVVSDPASMVYITNISTRKAVYSSGK